MQLDCAGVYLISCAENGRIYIGSSAHIGRRFTYHRRDLRAGKHASRHMQLAWDKHGEKAFLFEVLEATLDARSAREREAYYLMALRPFGDRGFNSVPTVGSTTLGLKYSAVQRQQLSIPLAQYDLSGSLIQIWHSAKNAAVAAGLRGPDSIYRAAAMPNGVAGGFMWRQFTEGCASFSIPPYERKPRLHTDEMRKKASVSNAKRRKWVSQIDYAGSEIVIWDGLRAAADSIGVTKSVMSRLARSRSTCRGYRWKYTDRAIVS